MRIAIASAVNSVSPGNSPSNRNSNKGIVTAAYEPWQPLLDAMKQLNDCAYPLAAWFDEDGRGR